MESAALLSRPSLPPIQSLDMDKYKREEVEYQTRHVNGPATTMPPSTINTSAPTSYPAGPPPPYTATSHSTSHPSTVVSHPSAEIRRQPIEVNDGQRQQTKQSLPSLHEALGNSSSESARVANPPEPPYTPSYPHPSTAYSQPQRVPATYSERRSPDYDHPAYARSHPQRSPRSTTSHHRSDHHHPYASVEYREAYEPPQPPPPSASSAYPGASQSLSYGYAPQPPRFASTAAGPPSTPIFQPSISQPPPPQHSSWRHEGPPASGGAPLPRESVTGESHPSASYGESVKRHLDMYDFEMALSEIADHSTIMLDFSRSYGARLHQTQRSGPVPGTLPAITEVDELMNKSKYTLDALSRLREVLVAQQAAYIQQAQEQRFKSENDAKRNDSVHHVEKGDGFNGPEPKKRRGRAAAPGRCHSCNRAETPEWRRGPDGARTLCNACGLHYAKLTRKAGANKAAIGSSSLRPKSQERETAEPQQQE